MINPLETLVGVFRKKVPSKRPRRRSLTKRNEERSGAKGDYTFIEGLGNSRGRIRLPYFPTTKEPILSWERQELIQAGRYLYANDGIVKGAIDDLARYSLPLSPQSTTKDTTWNQQAEAFFKSWEQRADIKKRISYAELQKLASVCLDRDGDVGILHVADPKNGGHCVQLIESDRIIDHPEGKGEYTQGVLLDRYGRPTSYCIEEDTKKGFRIIRSDLMQLFLEPERNCSSVWRRNKSCAGSGKQNATSKKPNVWAYTHHHQAEKSRSAGSEDHPPRAFFRGKYRGNNNGKAIGKIKK